MAGAVSLAVLLGGGGVEAKPKKEAERHGQAAQWETPPPIEMDWVAMRNPDLVGYVSWYGPGFHGRRTASGERYNMHAMTCASRTLPFGTLLEVTNLDNGEKAVVRVNDRGPFYKHRILDLSLAAAKKLRFHRKGQTKVLVREISIDTKSANR